MEANPSTSRQKPVFKTKTCNKRTMMASRPSKHLNRRSKQPRYSSSTVDNDKSPYKQDLQVYIAKLKKKPPLEDYCECPENDVTFLNCLMTPPAIRSDYRCHCGDPPIQYAWAPCYSRRKHRQWVEARANEEEAEAQGIDITKLSPKEVKKRLNQSKKAAKSLAAEETKKKAAMASSAKAKSLKVNSLKDKLVTKKNEKIVVKVDKKKIKSLEATKANSEKMKKKLQESEMKKMEDRKLQHMSKKEKFRQQAEIKREKLKKQEEMMKEELKQEAMTKKDKLLSREAQKREKEKQKRLKKEEKKKAKHMLKSEKQKIILQEKRRQRQEQEEKRTTKKLQMRRNIVPSGENSKFSCPYPMYMYTLRRRPCLWVYVFCPKGYPNCLRILNMMSGLGRVFMFVFAIILWTPFLICVSVMHNLFCCSCQCS